MGNSVPRRTRHLSLDNLAVNPKLARRLPPALACRYHALPVAEDNNRITVAMADPENTAAREAIETALGTTCCVVRGDPAAIDALLATIWPKEAHHSLRLLVCGQASSVTDELQNYAQAMGNLLQARVGYLQIAADTNATLNALSREMGRSDYNLVIVDESDELLLERLLWGPTDQKAGRRVPSSLLLARRPLWPLRRLLLVLQGQGRDEVVLDWAVRLARPSAATVTVLAWVVPKPTQRSGEPPMPQGLNALLTTDTALGQQMRRLSQRLVNWEIEGTLRLYQGPPDQQIRREIAEGNYDLIATAAEPLGPAQGPEPEGQRPHRPPGKLTASLLRWAVQPVLIAQPGAV